MELAWLGTALALTIMFVGLAGIVLPLLPGAPLIFLGMVVFGLFYGFCSFTWLFWTGQGLLLVLVYATDYIASMLGTKHYGGSKAAIWGCVIGGVVGLFTLGPLGIILGPLLGAITGELISKRPPAQAVKAGIGTVLGLAGGAVIKVIIGIGMSVWFLVVAF